MRLYRIVIDGSSFYVEAESFGEAVNTWREHMRQKSPEDWDGEEEPDSVEYLSDNELDGVIRAS